MTKVLLIIPGLFLLILLGCDTPTNNRSSKTKLDKDTIGYFAARNLDGFGEFKIFRSTNEIIKPLEKTMNLELLKVKEYEEPYDSQYIVQLIADTTEKYLTDTSRISYTYCTYCEQASIYKVRGYTISNTLINEIYLTFFKDSLIQIFCDFSIYKADFIKDAFDFKYGKPKEYKSSNNLLKELTRTWQNDRVVAELYTTDHNDKNMGYIERATLSIKLKGSLFDTYIDCNNKGKISIKEKAEKLKIEKMKNF